MIRFVDFGFQLDPDGPRKFGFWHTADDFYVKPGFIVVNLRESWASWDDFVRDHAAECEDFEPQALAPRAEDLKGRCPPWVFE